MASHWTCRLALALLWLGLSGCSGETDCIAIPEPLTSRLPAPGIVITGQPVRMRVEPTVNSTGCGTVETSIPSSGTVEIEGPGGEPLEGKLTLVPSYRAPAILEFTPQRQGPHHIVVAFSGLGGLHQFDLHSAQSRSADAPSEILPTTCETLERTSKGAWTCGSSVLRDSKIVRSFSGARLAVADDVIWVVDGGNVRRFVDTGTDLVQTASFSEFRAGMEFLLASRDELLVLHSFVVAYYTFNAGIITSPFPLLWSPPSEPVSPRGPNGILLRDGARLGLVTRTGFGDEAAIQVCTYPLAAGGIQPPQKPCPSVRGELIGFESGVLWTRDLPAFNSQGGNEGLSRRWVWTGGQLLEQGSISLGPNTKIFERPLRHWNAVPLVRNHNTNEEIPPATAALTWYPQKRAVLLEFFEDGLTSAAASSSLYWGWPPSAPSTPVTRVYRRPLP